MRDTLLILCASALCVALLSLVGCAAPNCDSNGCCCCCPCCNGEQCCPFDDPNCVPGQPCDPCPDGVCPLRPAGNIEIGEAREGNVDTSKLNEVKDGVGVCPTCPNRPTVSPPAVRVPVPSPTFVPNPAPTMTANTEIRQGVFRCSRCNKPTVGEDWHELWTDDDTSLMCLCESCWQVSTAAEKRAYLSAHVESSNLPATQRFYADQLIGSIR